MHASSAPQIHNNEWVLQFEYLRSLLSQQLIDLLGRGSILASAFVQSSLSDGALTEYQERELGSACSWIRYKRFREQGSPFENKIYMLSAEDPVQESTFTSDHFLSCVWVFSPSQPSMWIQSSVQATKRQLMKNLKRCWIKLWLFLGSSMVRPEFRVKQPHMVATLKSRFHTT